MEASEREVMCNEKRHRAAGHLRPQGEALRASVTSTYARKPKFTAPNPDYSLQLNKKAFDRV
jgi:hypothetical protein